jgi:hypothetical protein
MFESYRAHHRINNLPLGFPLGEIDVGREMGGVFPVPRLQPIDSLVITTMDGNRLIFWSPHRHSRGGTGRLTGALNVSGLRFSKR